MSQSHLGIPLSPEHRKNIISAMIRRWADPSFHEKMVKHLKGRKLSEEHKKKISEANKGKKYRKGSKHAQETKDKIRAKAIGRKVSEITKIKLRLSSKKLWENSQWRNKMMLQRQSSESREKISKSHMGDKNPAWKGGISSEPYGKEFNEDLKNLIKNRDKECQILGCYIKTALHLHHIDYNKKNNDPLNLLCLCRSHHTKTNINREYWMNLFQEHQRGRFP